MECVRLCVRLFPLLALTACATQQRQAIDVRAINSVQAQIKNQVGVYMLASQQNPIPMALAGVETKDPDQYTDLFWCGSGAIGFDISTVKAELTTTLDTKRDAGIGIKTLIITIGADFNTEAISTQTLDYNLWPLSWEEQRKEFKDQTIDKSILDAAPIAQVLLALRDSLILSTMKYDYSGQSKKERPPQPCFRDYDPENLTADPGNSFKLDLSFTRDTSGNIGVTLATPVAPTFSLSGERKLTTGNSITVTFVQQGLRTLQAKKDAAEKACAEPVKDRIACDKAKKEYANEKEKKKGMGINIMSM